MNRGTWLCEFLVITRSRIVHIERVHFVSKVSLAFVLIAISTREFVIKPFGGWGDKVILFFITNNRCQIVFQWHG